MFTKWIIEGIDGYRFGEDGELYRLPFERNKRSYDWRRIRKQYPNRWLIKGEMWSQDQLRPKLRLDPEPLEIFKEIDLPF